MAASPAVRPAASRQLNARTARELTNDAWALAGKVCELNIPAFKRLAEQRIREAHIATLQDGAAAERKRHDAEKDLDVAYALEACVREMRLRGLFDTAPSTRARA